MTDFSGQLPLNPLVYSSLTQHSEPLLLGLLKSPFIAPLVPVHQSSVRLSLSMRVVIVSSCPFPAHVIPVPTLCWPVHVRDAPSWLRLSVSVMCPGGCNACMSVTHYPGGRAVCVSLSGSVTPYPGYVCLSVCHMPSVLSVCVCPCLSCPLRALSV